MAKFKSALVTQASGSIGGMTFSRNKGGMYIRSRALVTNPNTIYQQTVRGRFSALAAAWTNVLTAGQRELWGIYGELVPVTNSLGDQINLSGLAWYQACNGARMQASLARIDDAPTNFTLCELTNPIVASVTASTDVASVVITNSDEWATATGGALIVQASRGQNPSVNFFKGPYRFADVVAGASTPPTSPQSIDLPFDVAAGQKVFFQFRAVAPDGRISAPFRTVGTAA
jgi:hypothetical protein